MFKSYEMMQTDIKHNVQGGEGSPKFRHLFSAEELGNRGELLAVITLEPGESVGVHPHTSNGEAYFILEGGATMTEDDETRILGVGDAEFCADGHTAYEKAMRVAAAGFAPMEDMLAELDAEEDNLQFAMTAYGLCVLLEAHSETEKADALRQKLLVRDGFWFCFSYLNN